MDDLRRVQDSSMWDQGNTQTQYAFPMPSDREYPKEYATLREGDAEDDIYRVGKFFAHKSPQSHIGPFKHAIDFLVPDGTEVLAADDGVVIEVVDTNSEWGPTEAFRDTLNWITIRHLNLEHSQYCHLAPQSFTNTGLKVGDRVKKGQKIAVVGKTGWTDRDHLHFIVFRVGQLQVQGSSYGFYSLKIRFENM